MKTKKKVIASAVVRFSGQKKVHTDVKDGWPLFIGGWFALNFFYRDGVGFRRDGIPASSHNSSTGYSYFYGASSYAKKTEKVF